MENKKKKFPPFLIFFCILMGITVLLCGAVAAVWLQGRYALTHTEKLPSLPSLSTEETNITTDGNTIVYNGKRYQYNKDMCNILLLGIDSYSTAAEAAGNHDQADVLVLAALDLAGDTMSLISIPRDTICDMEILDETGASSGVMRTQLALAYAYGDGQHKSCQLTCDAVSNIFHGLPIHGYGAYYLGGIETLNDAVGGVTVTILDDFAFTESTPERYRMIPGHTINLVGYEARAYIRARVPDLPNSNELRMRRQKQYMLALIDKVMDQVKENPACVLSLYDTVDDYLLTDLDISRISYLATEAVSMDFTGDIHSLTGEITLDRQNHVELTLDQTALYELMLDVFYTEVP